MAIRGEVQVVVTTAEYRKGQAAAWRDFEKDPDMRPNPEILGRVDPEFRHGYVDEFNTFITPARARMDA
jgi:hypothetical protein